MTTTPPTSAPGTAELRTSPVARSAGRRSNVALWVLQALLAALYVMSALPKLAGDPQTVAGFAAIGFGASAVLVIGVLEIAGAVALLIPRLCGVAALAFVALMVGAVVATVIGVGVGMAAIPAVVLVLVAVVAWARRGHTAELVADIRRHIR